MGVLPHGDPARGDHRHPHAERRVRRHGRPAGQLHAARRLQHAAQRLLHRGHEEQRLQREYERDQPAQRELRDTAAAQRREPRGPEDLPRPLRHRLARAAAVVRQHRHELPVREGPDPAHDRLQLRRHQRRLRRQHLVQLELVPPRQPWRGWHAVLPGPKGLRAGLVPRPAVLPPNRALQRTRTDDATARGAQSMSSASTRDARGSSSTSMRHSCERRRHRPSASPT